MKTKMKVVTMVAINYFKMLNYYTIN